MIHTELYDRDQVQMVSLGELIAEDNPVRVLDLFVDKIDMEGLGLGAPARDSSLGGRPAFRPQTLLKIYLYGYYNRIRSSRKLEAECERNIEMQWLTGRQMPNYHTIADFRKDHPGR